MLEVIDIRCWAGTWALDDELVLLLSLSLDYFCY